jgi:shikimate kinase
MSDPAHPARVYLIGPRGSGKTTVAAPLAEALGWGWIDADRLLEERAGQSIRAVFETEGEPAFRERESALLRELAALENQVIATGGGVILRPENRALLRATGWVVRLTAAVPVLCQRLAADPGTVEQRPALTGRSAIDPAEVAAVVAAREELYAATAHLTVDTTDVAAGAMVAILLAALSLPGQGHSRV